MEANKLEILSIAYEELMLDVEGKAQQQEAGEVPPPTETTPASTEDLLGPEDGPQPLIWLPEQNQADIEYRPYGYDQAKYCADLGHDERNVRGYVEEIETNDIPDAHSSGHTFKLTIQADARHKQPQKINGLLDSGANKSVISQTMYNALNFSELKPLPPMWVHGASGESLHPLGIATFKFTVWTLNMILLFVPYSIDLLSLALTLCESIPY